MASDRSNSSTSSPEQTPAHAVSLPPPQYSSHYPPPPGVYPPFYYAQPPEGAHDPNGAPPSGPFLIHYPPPGMLYAYPAPGAPAYPPYPPPPAGVPQPSAPRTKRKQVKMACTNCASACKRCDESRPCERCVKYGISDTCVDGVRKERKKGIKRGPYKRKNKMAGSDPTYAGFPAQNGEGEQSAQPGPYVPPPEGYYPYYYPPPPPGFVAPTHDGQPNAEGVANGSAPPIPHPYYAVHSMYPPYPPYASAVPASYPPPSLVPVPTQAPSQETAGKSEAHAGGNTTVNEVSGSSSPTKSKKRSRPKNGEESGSKTKKAKHMASEVNGTTNTTAEANGEGAPTTAEPGAAITAG